MNEERRGRFTEAEALALEESLLRSNDEPRWTREEARAYITELSLEETIVLDAATKQALEEGIRAAEEDPRRWSTEEVFEDARRLAREWQKMVNQKSA